MATKVTVNDIDEFVISKSKEPELRKWLENNADIIVENINEQDLEEDEMVIDFEPVEESGDFTE